MKRDTFLSLLRATFLLFFCHCKHWAELLVPAALSVLIHGSYCGVNYDVMCLNINRWMVVAMCVCV